uniref:uncharacterized protein LOC122592747 n=1 Tax=Erigeron canadensis TaxID=72917 RepID=UPI001CB972EA|nr:uncharacterized protein LOC122592747 [Erigeron canadensis]
MGGGIAMRAAAKAAGMGAFTTRFRGGDNPVVSVARRTALSSVANSGEDIKLVINSKNDVESVEKPLLDDWEFAGEEEDELFMDPGEPSLPRLVFGGVPTIQEATQATDDLKFALQQTYLSTNATYGQQSSDSENVVAGPDVASQNVVPHSPTNHAMQAFRLFNDSPSARTVVASIASDPNVWNAVLQNADLVDYLQTQRTETDPHVEVVLPETDPMVNHSSDESSETGDSKSGPGKGFMEYVVDVKQKISVTVVGMMNSLSDTFQSFFGGLGKDEFTVNHDGTAAISAEKAVIGASLMGLAIMVISVVVLKRPAL